jgi:phage shock protein A
MGLLSRLARLLHIRLGAALERVEDPLQMLDYSYQKQMEQYQKIRQSIVEIFQTEKLLELQQQQLQEKINGYDRQALQALQLEREDLARMALQRKELLLPQLNSYEQQLAQLRAQEEQLLGMERQVAASLEAFRVQKELMKAQYRTARARVNIQETLGGISEELSRLQLAMQGAQEKLLEMQARAAALETLMEEGVLGRPLLPSSGDRVDEELQRFALEQNVEAQLRALKWRLQAGGPAPDGQSRLLPEE